MQITIREPGSALTHFIGMMMALAAATPLLIKAAASSTAHTVLAMSIFMLSMVLLYGGKRHLPFPEYQRKSAAYFPEAGPHDDLSC